MLNYSQALLNYDAKSNYRFVFPQKILKVPQNVAVLEVTGAAGGTSHCCYRSDTSLFIITDSNCRAQAFPLRSFNFLLLWLL